MTRPQIPVYAKTDDWPRKVATVVNPIVAEYDFLLALASSVAAASIDFLQLEGDANISGSDGLLLSGDAQVSAADFLLY